MPKWIRVRDTQTGHMFDIDARALPHRRGIEPVNDPDRWPDIEGPRAVPRPAKPMVGKDGKARPTHDGEQVDAVDATGDPPQGGERTGGRRRTSKATSTPADAPADPSKEQ